MGFDGATRASGAPTPDDAAKRLPVQLADGRTGVLVWVPGRTHCGNGTKAKVLLRNNQYLSVSLDDLTFTAADEHDAMRQGAQ